MSQSLNAPVTSHQKYNLDAVKAKLAKFEGKKGDDKAKQTFWKPEFGSHDIRFMPYRDKNGQPGQEILYYKRISDKRIIAPSQFGLPDPVEAKRQELFKSEDKETRSFLKWLTKNERYYALIIDRAEEEKGVQLWEMSADTYRKLLNVMVHKDYIDEDLTSAETGYDFTVTVSQDIDGAGKPRMYEGKPVKKIELQPRRKPSKLHSKADVAKKWLDGMINLEEYFKVFCPKEETLQKKLEELIVEKTGMHSAVAKDENEEVEPVGSEVEKATAELDEQFENLMK